MEETMRTERYRKDEDREALLRRLNGLLAPLDAEAAGAAGILAPRLPVIFVVGAPQSATTLVSQIFSHAGCFGYVSNFVARFYQAPGLGLLLQRALGLEGAAPGSFRSEYGVTSGWGEPHEFGYFWDRWFDLGQGVHKLGPDLLERVDRDGLRAAVGRMEAVDGRPIVFKNNTWCTFQVAFLRQIFPDSLWVVCQRHPLYNAQSIAVGRRLRYGDIRAWWSVRPAQYPELKLLPWWEQVAGQMRHTLDDLEEGLGAVDLADIIRVRYEALCRDPGAPLREAAQALRRRGIEVVPAEPGAHFDDQDRRVLPDDEWELLHKACLRRFGPVHDGWNMEG